MAASTTAVPDKTIVTYFMTIDSDSATFGIGTLTVTLTIPTSGIVGGGIVTDTSSPPPRPTTAMSTTMAAPSATSTASIDTTSGPSAGQMAGIIVGSVAGGCLLTAFVFFCFCWRRRRKFQQLTKQKALFAGTDVDPKLNHEAVRAGTFGMPAPQQMTGRQASNRRSLWRRSLGATQMPVAMNPAERQRFNGRFSNTRPSSRAYLQISAPTPIDRPSIHNSFGDRFFRQPAPRRPAGDDETRHGSDATTIRTSGNPPTPVRPAITLLRLCSSSTSKSKSNSVDDEDKDYENDDVPPLPTLAAFGMPSGSKVRRPSLEESSRKDLETGIRANLSKATSRIPLTPGWDSSNPSPWVKSQAPPIPRSALSKPRKEKTVQWGDPRPSGSAASRSAANLKAARTRFPNLSSPPLTILEIPERSSSRQGMRQDPEPFTGQQWISTDNGTNIAQYDRRPSDGELLVSPLTATFSPSTPDARKTSFPRKPVPSSGTQFVARDTKNESPVSPEGTYQSLPPANIFKYSRKPLPPIARADDGMKAPSDHTAGTHRLRSPGRLSIPPTNRQTSQGQPSDNYNSSRATLTPNRTPTGDLVLTVDMLDYIVYD